MISYYLAFCSFTQFLLSAPDEHLVKNLPGLSETPPFTQHAGYLNLGEYTDDSRYFYWLFHKNKNIKQDNKILIWLNGGPGCTSADGIILEKGIFNISGDSEQPDDIKLKVMDDGWHTFTKVLMVDQPLGTGYSIGQTKSYARSVSQAADYFAMFMKEFFEKYPEYKDDQVFIGGESWAGVWIPYIADKLIKTQAGVQLKGLLIGNGWIDPVNQYPGFIPYIEKNNILPKEHLNKIKDKFTNECEPILKQNPKSLRVESCEGLITEITEATLKQNGEDKTCLNLYDIRLRDPYPECGMAWPPNVEIFRTYMARPKVASALNGELPKDHKWMECDSTVYKIINNDPSKPPIDLFPDLLKQLKIYLFVGNKDLMTPINGIQSSVNKLVEQYPKKIQLSQEAHWYHSLNEPPEGEVVNYPELNLTLVTVYDGSHMVSFDKPSEVSGMIRFFMEENDKLEDNPSFYLREKKLDVTEPIIDNPNNSQSSNDHVNTASSFYIIFPIIIIIIGVIGGLVWFVYNRQQHKKFLDIHHPINEESGLVGDGDEEEEILLTDRGGFMDGYHDDDDEEDDF